MVTRTCFLQIHHVGTSGTCRDEFVVDVSYEFHYQEHALSHSLVWARQAAASHGGRLDITRANHFLIPLVKRYPFLIATAFCSVTSYTLPAPCVSALHIYHSTCPLCARALNPPKPNKYANAQLNAQGLHQPRQSSARLGWSNHQDITSSLPSPCANSPPLPNSPLAAPKLMTSAHILLQIHPQWILQV